MFHNTLRANRSKISVRSRFYIEKTFTKTYSGKLYFVMYNVKTKVFHMLRCLNRDLCADVILHMNKYFKYLILYSIVKIFFDSDKSILISRNSLSFVASYQKV